MVWLLAAPFVLLAFMLYAALAFLFYAGVFLAWLFASLVREVREARRAGPRPLEPPPAWPGPPLGARGRVPQGRD